MHFVLEANIGPGVTPVLDRLKGWETEAMRSDSKKERGGDLNGVLSKERQGRPE